MVVEINQDNFTKEVLKSETPVIVDFWAAWCGPCKMLAPVFEELSKDYEGKLKFAKVNVEDEKELAGKYGVRGIPNLKVLNKGEVVGEIVGFKPKEELKKDIDAILAKI
tara:strand:+ start:892 stop:1218 length:327 start_codon:yes stop_codon:yes gene_type:complete